MITSEQRTFLDRYIQAEGRLEKVLERSYAKYKIYLKWLESEDFVNELYAIDEILLNILKGEARYHAKEDDYKRARVLHDIAHREREYLQYKADELTNRGDKDHHAIGFALPETAIKRLKP